MVMFKSTHELAVKNLQALHEMEVSGIIRNHETEMRGQFEMRELERVAHERAVSLLTAELELLRAKGKTQESNPIDSMPLNEGEQGFNVDEVRKRMMMWTDSNVPVEQWQGEGVKLWSEEPVNGEV